ncbi:IucA/IucC family protein [Streptacidiphilus sp. P02-A3a]|uniref:IucA/IucC family protein n=1 Tax=Streptacidiphilus sp. P02-A3a TaxID=2704468 RepID=UPI001CDB5171|nr:IucA/IucC family protein [Streptacidiphilus sp. P02-A3a]
MSHEMRPLEASFAAELRAVRPGLLPGFAEALPGARAAVLARLWRALLFEPGLAAAVPPAARERLRGPRPLPYDVGAPKDELSLRLGDREYTHPAELLHDLGVPGSRGLVAELDHSVASLALSRADAVGRPGDTLVDREQSVVDGHPYHPCCRSRPGFSVADQLAYAPEHRQRVPLGLVAVPSARCLLVGDWPRQLRDGDLVLLPAHPWQLREVLPRLGFAATGDTLAASPLMSVRTLAPVDGGPHLKTSLSLRMTSAVRDISGESVANSAPLSALLERVCAELGGALRISRNLASAAALTDGAPSPDLAVLVRESPEAYADPGERVVPLAALAEHPPPLADPVPWLRALAALAWTPLLRLLALGVAMEAHGQNLLVVLDPLDRPLRLVYRDLADVRVSRERLAAHGVRADDLGGHVLDDDPVVLRRKLFGSLLGGTLSALVSALGRGDRQLERLLWGAVAAEAGSAARAELPAADRRALLREPLPVKALTQMRLAGQRPGDQWTLLPNPLADGAPDGPGAAP